MAGNEIKLSPGQILAAIHQHLGERFFAADKTSAKQAFKQLNSGGSLPLLQIRSTELGDVLGVLKLDRSEFVGNLNFSVFRDALAAHLDRVGEKLRNEEDLNVFTSEQTGAMLFHIPGLIKTDDRFNVLVTGLEQRKAGKININLMFLDPANYDGLEKKH